MTEDRIESAVARIERALTRISAVAEDGPVTVGDQAAANPPKGEPATPQPTSVSQLVVAHEELREVVATELKRLDAIIERLEG